MCHPGLKLKGLARHVQLEVACVVQAVTIKRAKEMGQSKDGTLQGQGHGLWSQGPGQNPSSAALLLCDPEKFPNHTCLGFSIHKRWMISRVLTAWGCCEKRDKEISSEMSPGIQPVLGGTLGGDKVPGTALCAEAAGLACMEGREEQAMLAGAVEEKLGEGACGLDVGACGAEVPFEGVFHEDLSDEPDWKGECLLLETWEEAVQQPRASRGDGETRGGP